MNPKNPTEQLEKQEHEDSGRCCLQEVGVLLEVEEVGVLVDNIELNYWKKKKKRERKRTTLIVAFDYGFLTQENADTLPILIRRDSRFGQTGAKCCTRKGPTSTLHPTSCRIHQRSWFSQNHFEMRE